MRIDHRILVLLSLSVAAQAQAHIAPRPEPTGFVTGHVFCSDTNEPARFAHVTLEVIPEATKSKSRAKPEPTPYSTTVETALDGSYRLTKVRPGAYFVVVEKLGYIKAHDIFTREQLTDPAPEIRALVAAAMPRVVVESNRTETADIQLERGAAISGTIRYDDGSPAAEIAVKLLHKDADGKWVEPEGSDKPGPIDPSINISTEDRGYFRVPSLLANEYLVEADLSLQNSNSVSAGTGENQEFFVISSYDFTLPFYGSGVSRQKDAASIKLRPGQEFSGQDMTIPIAKLHKLTGHIAAGKDAHFINAATVTLVNRDDGTDLTDTNISREDGLFHFEFVPDGDYLLKVTEARDVIWDPGKPNPTNPLPPRDIERVIATYGNTEEPILLSGDLLDTLATISPDAVAAPPSTKPNPSGNTLDVNTQPPASPQTEPAPIPDPQAIPKIAPQLTPGPGTKSNVASLHGL